MDDKHRKLFVIKHSKECKYVPEMHQNTFGGQLRARWGSLCAPPELLTAIGGLLLRGGREGERGEWRKGRGEGLVIKGREVVGRDLLISRTEGRREGTAGIKVGRH